MPIDRFDVMDAHYVFAMLWHGGQFSEVYRYLGRLSRMGYKPGASVQRGELLSEGSRAVYRNLCKKHGV